MNTDGHFVEYHLIFVTYLDFERVVSGADMAQLWTALRKLGTYAASATYAYRSRNESTTVKDVVAGDPGVSEVLDTEADELDMFASSSFRRDFARDAVSDSDINFGFDRDGIWEGERTLGHVDLSLSGQVVDRAGTETILDLLKQYFEIVDRHAPPYGLVDLASPDDAVAGAVYGTCWPGHAPLHRYIEQHSWVMSAAKKGDRVRGIYWGNYFGPKILERLGGRDSFVEGYRQVARKARGEPDAHIWEFRNGVFVSLSLDPMQWQWYNGNAGYAITQRNLFWLNRELGTKGVSCPW